MSELVKQQQVEERVSELVKQQQVEERVSELVKQQQVSLLMTGLLQALNIHRIYNACYLEPTSSAPCACKSE